MNTLSKNILKAISDYYLKSHDFNGISLEELRKSFPSNRLALKDSLTLLIKAELIGIIDEKTSENPHIIRMGFEPVESQLPKILKRSAYHVCIYPRYKHLNKVVDKQAFEKEPYKLRLALGDAQLSYHSFDLSVLEIYRSDPRYRYNNDDIQGHIYCKSENNLPDGDKVYLQTYGFAYDKDFNRAVAVFTRYLYDLTPEHQRIWQSKELHGDFKLHPDYYRNAILGAWGKKVPICNALLKELFLINKMSIAMGKPPLFMDDFGEYGDRRPKKFGLLIRPTLEEFNSFCLLFDKMLSDNINKDFFRGELPLDSEIKRADNKIGNVPLWLTRHW